MLKEKNNAMLLVSLVTIVAIVGLVSLSIGIWGFRDKTELTGALAGGQGKAKGNACMAQCMKVEAEFYDASSDLTRFCQEQCNVGAGAGSCLTSEDGCCVPYADDPDCVSALSCSDLGGICGSMPCAGIDFGQLDCSSGYTCCAPKYDV